MDRPLEYYEGGGCSVGLVVLFPKNEEKTNNSDVAHTVDQVQRSLNKLTLFFFFGELFADSFFYLLFPNCRTVEFFFFYRYQIVCGRA